MFTKIFRIIVLAGIFLSLCEQSFAQVSEINPGNVFYKGGQNSASDVSSIIGTNNNAWGQNSFAGGLYSSASGNQAFAFGEGTETTQENAFAIGKSTKAYGKQAFALGHDCTASGENSFAGGVHSSSGYIQSFAFGLNCISNSPNSFALGHTAITSGANSFALGQYVEAGDVYTSNNYVFGCGFDADNKLVNTLGGIMMGTNSNLPTFFISKSGGIGRTGRIGIGYVTDPQAKLHIKGDSGEVADILLEPTDTEKAASINFWDDAKNIQVGSDGQMDINVPNHSILLNSFMTGISNRLAIGDVPNEELSAKLHIRSDIGEDAGIILEPKDTEASNTFIQLKDEDHGIEVDRNGVMKLNSKNGDQKSPLMINGIVGVNVRDVNKLNSGYSLYVEGDVLAEKVSIKSYGHWPDFVFGNNYELMPLGELKQYVAENSHLPNVPSEAEVNQNGIDVGDMQGILLKKIEELTLYILQQEERITELENELKAK